MIRSTLRLAGQVEDTEEQIKTKIHDRFVRHRVTAWHVATLAMEKRDDVRRVEVMTQDGHTSKVSHRWEVARVGLKDLIHCTVRHLGVCEQGED